jgi:hypothetical protein
MILLKKESVGSQGQHANYIKSGGGSLVQHT